MYMQTYLDMSFIVIVYDIIWSDNILEFAVFHTLVGYHLYGLVQATEGSGVDCRARVPAPGSKS